MTQSRTHSLFEVITSTAAGYVVALIAQMIIFPLYGLHVALAGNVQIAMIFTVISIIRSYVFRRVFNRFAGRMTKNNEEV